MRMDFRDRQKESSLHSVNCMSRRVAAVCCYTAAPTERVTEHEQAGFLGGQLFQGSTSVKTNEHG